MGMRKRTARRFQVEALETRWTPGAGTGIGGDFLQIHVAPLQAHVAPPGGGMSEEVAPTRCGGRTGIGGEV
jgi:hypothetical protein